MKKCFFLTILFLLFNSCGGTWENDNDTWEKTFGEEKPKEIELLNSYFWKSSHWTYEFEVFLEMKYNQKWLLKIINDYEMEAYLDFSLDEIGFVNEKPIWFTPKKEENYIIFKSKKFEAVKIFIDKKTNVIYFIFCQL